MIFSIVRDRKLFGINTDLGINPNSIPYTDTLVLTHENFDTEIKKQQQQ